MRNYNVSWESEDADPGTQEFDDVTEGLVVGLEKCHTYTFSVAAGTIVWGNKSETREVEVVNYGKFISCLAVVVTKCHFSCSFILLVAQLPFVAESPSISLIECLPLSYPPTTSLSLSTHSGCFLIILCIKNSLSLCFSVVFIASRSVPVLPTI